MQEMYISTLIIDKIISLFLNLKARIFFVIKIYKFEKREIIIIYIETIFLN